MDRSSIGNLYVRTADTSDGLRLMTDCGQAQPCADASASSGLEAVSHTALSALASDVRY